MSLPNWPNWYDPRINVVRDIPTEIETGYEAPIPLRPTRSTIKPIMPTPSETKDDEPSETKSETKSDETKDETKSDETKDDEPVSILPDTQPVIHSKLDYSIFSDIAYADKNKRASLLEKKTRLFDYDDKNSTDELAVFKTRGSNPHAVIAIRGTHVRGDLGTDAGILFGNPENTARYRRNAIQIKNIQDTLGLKKDDITLTGHSLGGSIAASEAARFGYKAVTFNAGFSPLSMLRDPNRDKYKNADIVNYTTPLDIISISSQLPNMPKTYVLPISGGLNPHSIKNFTNQIGDYSVDRFDLFEPGSNTEKTAVDIKDWNKQSVHPQTDHKKFSGAPGEKLPTPPTLYEIITGKKQSSVVSTIDAAVKNAQSLVKPFIDADEGFMAIRELPGAILPEPTLSLGGIEPELSISDIFGPAEEDILNLGLDEMGIGELFGDFGG